MKMSGSQKFALVLGAGSLMFFILAVIMFVKGPEVDAGHLSPSSSGLRNPEMAYRHGIQVGQQMIMHKLMPTAEGKEKARLEVIELIQQADKEGLGIDSKPLDEYRVVR
jgi:hypothetical protein